SRSTTWSGPSRDRATSSSRCSVGWSCAASSSPTTPRSTRSTWSGPRPGWPRAACTRRRRSSTASTTPSTPSSVSAAAPIRARCSCGWAERGVVATPSPGDLPDLVDALATWQHDGAPVPLHPGDVGWLWRFGADATAGALRTWSRDGRLLAVGMLDGPDLLRLACAPDAWTDRDLADEIRADLDDPAAGVLAGVAPQVEARWPGALTDPLRGAGGA